MLSTIKERKNFGYFLIFVTIIIFLVANFLGLRAEKILVLGQTPNHFIGSAHSHMSLMSLTVLVFLIFFIVSLDDMEWPRYLSESANVAMVIGAFMFPFNLMLKALGMMRLSSNFTVPGITLFTYGVIVYTICFGIGASFGGDS